MYRRRLGSVNVYPQLAERRPGGGGIRGARDRPGRGRPLQRPFDGPPVPAGTESAKRLGAFGTLRPPVRLRELRQGLRRIGVHVGADGTVGTLRKPLETLLQHGLDVPLDDALADALQESTRRLYPLEFLPNPPGQFVGQLLCNFLWSAPRNILRPES